MIDIQTDIIYMSYLYIYIYIHIEWGLSHVKVSEPSMAIIHISTWIDVQGGVWQTKLAGYWTKNVARIEVMELLKSQAPKSSMDF